MKYLWRRHLGVLLVMLSLLVIAQDSWAGSKLLQVHKQVLAQYQQDHDATKAFIALQLAGIKQAIDKQPAGMSTPDYVHLLNDFAFFRYQSTAFKENIPMTVHFKKLTYVGNERMQRYDDITNATMRLNRLCQAKQILEKVITLDPERSIAYLNLADVYWRSGEYAQKLGFFGGRQGWEARKVRKLLHCQGDEKQGFDDFFRAYDTYKLYRDKMIEQGKEEQIPERVSRLLARNTYASVIQDANIQLGDYQLCEDYEEAMNLLPDEELAPPGGRRTGVGKYSDRFTSITFDSFPPELQQKIRKGLFWEKGRDNPSLVCEHNGHAYVETKDGFLNMIHSDPEEQRWHGATSWRCLYRVLDFKRKFAMSYY